jgi:hypothetical protein
MARRRVPAAAALDRIDDLVRPGSIVSVRDDRRLEPWLQDSRLRGRCRR